MKEQMKEAYKRDLKERQAFLEQAKRLRASQTLSDAVTGITAGLEDDTDTWIEKLNTGSVLTEAKMEMALENEASTEAIEKLAQEAELEKFSAADLVRQMKKEMGLLEDAAIDEILQEKPQAETPPDKRLGDF